MATYVSLLRGINVSGQKKISMDELRGLYSSSSNFEGVQSYIQSGNVIFRHSEAAPEDLAEKIEKSIADVYGYAVDVLIRTPADLNRVINNNPFAGSSDTRIDKLYVTFLAGVPDPSVVRQVGDKTDGDDSYIVAETEVYIHAPGGYGKTRFSNNYIEKKLRMSATTRNWKTVNKLLELSG